MQSSISCRQSSAKDQWLDAEGDQGEGSGGGRETAGKSGSRCARSARAMAVRTKMTSPRSAGLGRRRITCQTMMLIETILRAGESANEPSKASKAGGGFHSNDLPMPDCKQSGTAGARSLWFIT